MRANVLSVLVAVPLALVAVHCANADPDDPRPASLGVARQRVTAPANAPPSLKTVAVPRPGNLGDFVRDEAAAIRLGKALFWEMQVGSDGVTSCASCHFHAGADSRTKNQLAPGHLRAHPDGSSNPDNTFQTPAPNHRFTAADFPFRKLADPNNRSSAVLADTNDVAASQGVFYSEFVSVVPGSSVDLVSYSPDPDGFRVDGVSVRRVAPRNTPTVINAVFNYRNFWDGRAQNDFNGVNIWGARDPNAYVYKRRSDGKLERSVLSIPNSSLASQAVGPPLSSFEMSTDGRTFQEIGDDFVGGSPLDGVLSMAKGLKLLRKTAKKLVGDSALPPLDKQHVHPDDSVLGALSNRTGTGLKTDYGRMIKDAFREEWWKGDQVIGIESDGSRTLRSPSLIGDVLALGEDEYTHMEYNFSLFFGLAIQLYEATLVADDTPFDRFREGDTAALTDQQVAGLVLFSDTVRVRCINCHGGAELTDASVAKVTALRLRRREGNILDRGFNNIGVRPTFEDLGIGNADPFTRKPLSEARLAAQGMFFDPALQPPLSTSDIVGSDGAFKTPGIRNAELTGPYFHNGGQATLRQVIDFYSRGGDFQPIVGREGRISPLGTPNLTEAEKEALVAFMIALTDERVRFERAPFDHPELMIPDGHPGDEAHVTDRGNGTATDSLRTIPAVGRNGGPAITTFLGQ